MLPTFKAILKGNQLLWSEEVPQTSDRTLKVYVTILEEIPDPDSASRGQQMAVVLKQLAECDQIVLDNPVEWQREIRQDRPLVDRDG